MNTTFTCAVSCGWCGCILTHSSIFLANSLKYVVTTMIEEGDVSDAVVTTLKLAELVSGYQ